MDLFAPFVTQSIAARSQTRLAGTVHKYSAKAAAQRCSPGVLEIRREARLEAPRIMSWFQLDKVDRPNIVRVIDGSAAKRSTAIGSRRN